MADHLMESEWTLSVNYSSEKGSGDYRNYLAVAVISCTDASYFRR